MLFPGLVSVTFRQLAPEEIVKLAVKAGLTGIEWGGDVHVPHGDIARAEATRNLTLDAGLRVSAYGSYYRLRTDEPVPFEDVLATAVALGAPVIRVWAGDTPSASADETERARIVSASQRIADLAAAANIRIAYEFHGGTLTDDIDSTVRLLHDVDHSNVGTFWQPPVGMPFTQALATLNAVKPWLINLHAFHWGTTSRERYPLATGADVWPAYLQAAAELPGNRFVSLEFVAEDRLDNLLADAHTLRTWLGV